MPEMPDGEIKLSVTFNSSSLARKTIVAFETIRLGDVEVALHHDIGDTDQSVNFTSPPQPDAGEPNTLLLSSLLFASSAAGLILLLILRRKKHAGSKRTAKDSETR